jgi:hypothetical protein
MNTQSAREYTIFAPSQLYHNWCEQQPSQQDDLDSSVMWEVGRVHYMGVDLLLISFLRCSARLLLGCVLNWTPYITACRSVIWCLKPHSLYKIIFGLLIHFQRIQTFVKVTSLVQFETAHSSCVKSILTFFWGLMNGPLELDVWNFACKQITNTAYKCCENFLWVKN